MTTSLIHGLEPGATGVLRLAARARELQLGAAPKRFEGSVLAAVFFNASLRTRSSLESACAALRVHPIVLQPGSDAWGWEHRDGSVMNGAAAEHIREAVPVLASYADVLAVRSFARLLDADEDRADPIVSTFASLSRVPVVNLESAMWHPLQGLADVATWVSHLGPSLQGKRLCLSWAPHPKALPAAVPNQVLTMAAALGMEVTVAHPEGFDLDPGVVERAASLAADAGGGVTLSHDQQAALEGAQVVYAKSWSGVSAYGDRDGEATRRAAHADWRIDAVPAEAGFMHCLPVRRNVVAADAVLDGPCSWVQEQAAYRRTTAMAVLEEILSC
ncbi:MAG: N-acetylornithine carbamoyltransferase [Myxococcales bacterium]|nr:N-acetylornithine carbamoyltransferase [Myxococcales bacterium]